MITRNEKLFFSLEIENYLKTDQKFFNNNILFFTDIIFVRLLYWEHNYICDEITLIDD